MSQATAGSKVAVHSKADDLLRALDAKGLASEGKGKGRSKGKRCDASIGGSPTSSASTACPPLDSRSDASSPTAAQESNKRPSEVIFTEIRAIVDRNPALQLPFFDFRVRQHLHAFYGQGGEERLRAATTFIHNATINKERKAVRSWPAFIVALLKKFEIESPYQPREQCPEESQVVSIPTASKGSAVRVSDKELAPPRLAACVPIGHKEESDAPTTTICAPTDGKNRSADKACEMHAATPATSTGKPVVKTAELSQPPCRLPKPPCHRPKPPVEAHSASPPDDLDPGSLDFDVADWLGWDEETVEEDSPLKSTRWSRSHASMVGAKPTANHDEMTVASLGG